MAEDESALVEVLAWVRDVTSDSPALQPIVGIDDSENRQLARLGTLLREQLGDDMPVDLIVALTAEAPIEVTADALTAFDRLIEEDAVVHLAELYAAIVKPANRRSLGTFFTPRDSAKAIVDGYASRHKEPAEVVDVGAGVGIFSAIARAQWPAASIHAIDINPLTLGLQAVAAAGRPEWNVHLELADYRSWLASNSPVRPTLYLGNPPYTRWQLIDNGSRADLLEAAGGVVGARANLSTLFLAMTLNKLRPEDSIAMIIPAGWMRADYGKKLRSHLRAAVRRRISLRLADSWRFEQAIVDAVLVEVGPEVSALQPIEVSDWSGSEQLTVDRASGEAAFPAPGRQHLSTPASDSTEARLGELARVTRGTASGANAFFVKTAAGWDALGIPVQFRRALARRLRPGADSAPLLETAELLVLDDYQRGANDNVDAWIATAELAGTNELHLCAKRKSWFDLSAELKTPDVVVSALARDFFHVLPNTDGLSITNNLFGLYWKPDVNEATKERLVGWLRSDSGQAALRASSSVEANGLHRLSPRAVVGIELSDFSLNVGSPEVGLAGIIAIGTVRE